MIENATLVMVLHSLEKAVVFLGWYCTLHFVSKMSCKDKKIMKPESLHLKEGPVDHASSASSLKLEDSEVTQTCFSQVLFFFVHEDPTRVTL